MATYYLGEQFDIHGGGVDLVFPHHENEIAQSKAAGDHFARYWMHNSWVTAAGQKMGKSLGNALGVAAVLQFVRPVELRYHLASAHYRSTIEFSHESVAESAVGYRRIESFLHRVGDQPAPEPVRMNCPAAFTEAMDDDLGVPAAVAVLFDTVRAGNAAAERGDDEALHAAWTHVHAMAAILGVLPPDAANTDADAAMRALESLVAEQLAVRQRARAERDWATADAVRDRLQAAGIAVEDRSDGPTWSLSGSDGR